MSNKIKGCWIVFDHDLNEEDAEVTMNAIKQIKNVLSVKNEVVDINDWMARERVKTELLTNVINMINE